MTPSLHHLVEDHFKPKWWQFWRKQKYHVCKSDFGDWTIFEVPTKCIRLDGLHRARQCAQISLTDVFPSCYDGCPSIQASDPAFFTRLDVYLERECTERVVTSAQSTCPSGPSGAVGPQGPPGAVGVQGPPGPPGVI